MSHLAAARPAAEAFLTTCWRAAIDAVDAGRAVERAITREGQRLAIAGRWLPNDTQLCVLAAGKASVPMAAAVEAVAGDRVSRGIVVTREGQATGLRHLPVRETAHPVPDARSEQAARKFLSLAQSAGPREVVLVLLSGGASSLLSCPLPGLTLEEIRQTTEVLLGCGADISQLNCLRKHLLAAAGGRVAAVCSRPVEVLAVSDVPGDAIEVIGSGPCAGDFTTYADAIEILSRFGITARVPVAVKRHLDRGAAGHELESLAPDAAALLRVRTTLVATNQDARAAALCAGARAGWAVSDLGEMLGGEARECGRRLAGRARSARVSMPTLWVGGGETTVTLRGNGRGGRSQELALAAALEWSSHAAAAEANPERLRGADSKAGADSLVLLAAGTDGHDGPTDAAGAFANPDSVTRGDAVGISAAISLAENDAYTFFDAEGGLLRTGPTGTNVMDLVLVALTPSPS